MKTRTILAIARKDLMEVRQNKAAWMPMLIVPLIFVILIPLFVILLPQFVDIGMNSMMDDPDLQIFMQKMPESMLKAVEGLDDVQTGIVMVLGYMFAPMFLIFPLMFSTVVGSESFAGEYERKTMEALLYTPAADSELFFGKVTAALAPAVLISWASFLGYSLVVNLAALPLFGAFWFPLPGWWPLIFWITPALALLGVSATVLISARVKTFMGAYQLSASLVVLVLALLIGQITGVLYFNVWTGLLVGLIAWIIAIVLAFLAVRGFNRSTLILNQEK